MAAKKKTRLRKGRVKVEGLAQLEKALADMPGDLRKKIEPAVKQTMDAVLEHARTNVPVDSGTLREALYVHGPNERGSGFVGVQEIGDAEKYWPVIEFGWLSKGIEPQPFMYPAAQSQKRAHTQRVRKEVVEFVAEQNRRA